MLQMHPCASNNEVQIRQVNFLSVKTILPITNEHGFRPTLGESQATTLGQQCTLCGGLRSKGSLLASRLGIGNPILWVCNDCQHKLARRVDDEGTLGG